MKITDVKRIGVDIPKEQFVKLRHFCLEQDLKLYEAVSKAIELYLEKYDSPR
jgi:hypothetical protein